ncbi:MULTISPECIES: hypothetical protein [Streptomyces]|uniref:Uncharacterized protein n=1 Tax=Streptomyces griseosporeus TaxID=1910 RepID=A0ABV3KTA0_STRGS|nr:hypothetical protein [Streptomyces actuosus]MBM4824302.1 hypothetical protein [Streptomyces actuosus]
MSESALSRALSGKAVPERRSVEILFDAARSDASEQGIEVGITLADLYRLHSKAVAEQNDTVATRLIADLESMSKQLRDARDENEQLRSAYAALRAQQDELRQQASLKAISLRSLRRKHAVLQRSAATLRKRVSLLEAGSPARSPEAALPVPRQEGDRQRTQLDKAAARNVARRAEALYDGGRQADEVLALLRHTTDAYSPAETALLVVLLTQHGQQELVRDFLHIYGRDKPDREVLLTALELLKYGAPANAEALLLTAAATRGPKLTP